MTGPSDHPAGAPAPAIESWSIVGVVGAGTMGAGIAQVALEAGDEVVLHDVDPGAIDRARRRIADGLTRRAARLDLGSDGVDDWVRGRLSRLREALTLDALAAEAHVVIEAAAEDLELKQTIFRTLDATALPDAILATNTSALSVAAVSGVTARPDRVLGLHFFNPVPVLGLVEVIVTDLVAPTVVDRAERLVQRWGKTTVRCADTPGFIVNRVHRPFTIEALRLVETGAASVESIDAAMRDAGFPLGPFELMDLIGLDVNLAAATAVWDGLGRPERLRPSPIQAALVEAGRLGRKTGAGFYRYEAGRAVEAVTDLPSQARVERASLDASAIRDRIVSAIADEARLLADAGLAAPADIDLALRLGAGHPRPLLA